MNEWENTPPSWERSDDPCGTPWEGISCEDSRVTVVKLSSLGLKGTLSGDVGQLTELKSLDLSSNTQLGGPLTPNIGSLTKLTTLILAGCSFIGNIPDELGNLEQLSFLALNSNKFTGRLPASLGRLANLYWLDIAENQLTGPLPVSRNKAPGLDLLLKTKHFHFNKNQLSGTIPDNLFSSEMSLIHLLLDGNNFTGNIPQSIGYMQSLEVLRLDKNSLKGPVPTNLNNLTKVNELDLSNNTFDSSEAPAWFTKLPSLTALVIEHGRLQGQVPQKLFSIPQLQDVILDNNEFNGTLDMGDSISQQLQTVNFQNNLLTSVTLTSNYNSTLILVGNPVCDARLANSIYCHLQPMQLSAPYSTSLTQCGPKSCPPNQSLSPLSCSCAYPYEGVMVFRAPFFRDVTNSTLFESLEMSLWTKLNLPPGSVFLQNPFINNIYFNRSEILRIGFDLSNQTYKPPKIFGPYYFIGTPYPFPCTALIIGIAVGSAVLVIGLMAVGIYAFKQKKRAQRAIELSKPFASWAPRGSDSGGAPQLKGARWFSYDELKKSTSNFSEMNEIGSGGYGKVYRGMLSNGQLAAIKRAQRGSMQGGLEFKTEIELLSRVHHKNLVSLIGFCFEQGEQMLVYEFIPNGTLRESLSGKSGIQLDWKRRLRIALGSARGLAYLHELANPPIIHRDVKSTNILLDENLTAKVADFGLSKLVSDSEKGHVSTQVKGTLASVRCKSNILYELDSTKKLKGYLDPEYYMSQQLTEKSDVYSFGVVMLEMITARPPIERGKYIVREVKNALDKRDEEFLGLKDMIDPTIRNTAPLIGFGKYVELALNCVEELAADRPTMNEIVKEIELILHTDGLNTTSTSASSSATDFNSKGNPRHPYIDPLPKKEVSSDAFDYSGGYTLSTKVEPK
ncbi:Non-specific serine/threonine protein kinase protein [Dioscorea alata]|uniref:Non-specific serine/threonine protein kinase protein n=1 Tax=Dioscorea alata TaxID=55571 RepID=A0ACB7V257_DIOAL|nr:Non-specific serine/threonine protein kinase protein [Dioscorea alata]